MRLSEPAGSRTGDRHGSQRRPPAAGVTRRTQVPGSAEAVIDHALQVVASVGSRVGQMAVVRTDLGHGAAIAKHDLEPVLGLPAAFALDRHIHMSVAETVTLNDDLAARADVLPHLARAGDCRYLAGKFGRDVLVVLKNRWRGGPQHGFIEGEKPRYSDVEVFSGRVIVVPVDEYAAGPITQDRDGYGIAAVPPVAVECYWSEAWDFHGIMVRRPTRKGCRAGSYLMASVHEPSVGWVARSVGCRNGAPAADGVTGTRDLIDPKSIKKIVEEECHDDHPTRHASGHLGR